MKISKKKVFLAALAICLVAILSIGTLAWFSDSDEVNNNFLIADSTNRDPDKIFSIDVWEDVPGKIAEQEGYNYNKILPGDTLLKDVFVKNTGYYDQYVRVIVTISDAKAWLNAIPAGTSAEEAATAIFSGLNLNDWTHIYNNLSESNGVIPEDLVYILYYKDVLKASDAAINVFDSINIPTTLTQEQAALFEGGFSIKIKAQAVQTENVVPVTITQGKTAAWEAFNTVGMTIAD